MATGDVILKCSSCNQMYYMVSGHECPVPQETEFYANQEQSNDPFLTFDALRKANVKRCEASFHLIESWSPTDWACAMAGEVGEACNFIKKLRRLDDGKQLANIPKDRAEIIANISKELGDIVCYVDLLAARLGIDLAEAVADKFNEVSDRVKSDIKL